MEKFGELPGGEPVGRLTLVGGGLTARVLTWGAVLQDLRLDGHAAPLVLGFDSFAPYPECSPHFGAAAGRCANRIRDGHLELGGKTYRLDRNAAGGHMLHGGAAGTGTRLWRVLDAAADAATLGITLADGEMGFPGRLEAEIRYRLLPGAVLDIAFRAETEAPTLCNFAHHSYFNLDGGASVSDHLLRIAAEHYLPVDAGLIPTGELRPVAGTRFDFRRPRPVAQAHPLDHNFCLSASRRKLRPVAWLESPASGVALECRTTEPGLQLYDAGGLDIALPGLAGQRLGRHAGLAIEPQVWPDAAHHPHFPQAVLLPGETYRQETQFAFSKAPA